MKFVSSNNVISDFCQIQVLYMCTHITYMYTVHIMCIYLQDMCTHHLITWISFRVTSSSIKKTRRPDDTCEYCSMLLLCLQTLDQLF